MSEHELPLLAAIAATIRWVEELVSLLSGPLLSIGLAIALIDLLTGGGLLRAFPALLYGWGLCQAIGIDSQLVATWDRVRMSGRRKHWWAVIGYTILGLALAYVGFLSAETFGLQQAFGLSETDALARLGIDAASWQLQRAVLAVFLVALSGFTRYHAPAKQKQSAEDERATLERELELEPLRQQLRKAKAGGVAALARQTLAAAVGREDAPDKPPTGPGSPVAAPSGGGVRTPVRSQPAMLRLADANPRPRRRAAARAQGVRTPRLAARIPESVEPRARAAWDGGARSVEALQTAASISRASAQKYVAQFAAEARGEGKAQ